MQLPQFQNNIVPLQLMQNKWAAILNPIIALPLNNAPSLLKNLSLVSGSNVINHKLGRTPTGWLIIDQNAAIQVYRSNELNDLTLSLTSSGAATVTLLVF